MRPRPHSTGHVTSSTGPTKEGTLLRPFRITDYDAVFALWQSCNGVALGASDTRSAIAAYLRRNPGFSFVAQKNGALVGAVLGGHDGRRGYLHHLAVAAAHRRAGLGRKLVDRCLGKLRKAGIKKCDIFVFGGNAEGRTFWIRTGWSPRPDLCLLQVDLMASRTDAAKARRKEN
jgi:putative acetyltransferase